MPWSHWVGVGVRLQPVLHTKAAPGQALPGILRVLKIGQEFNAARDENPAPLWQRDPGLQPQAPCPGAVHEFSRQAPGVGGRGPRRALRRAAPPWASTVSTASGAAIGLTRPLPAASTSAVMSGAIVAYRS